MKQLRRMWMTLEMDRDIDPDSHYISPGGYSCNGKNFDFNQSAGNTLRDAGQPRRVEFELKDFDGSLMQDEGIEECVITPDDIKAGFEEFYIYTGEADEPEIFPEKIINLEFEFYDAKKDMFYTQKASEEILEGINGLLEEQRLTCKSDIEERDISQ